MTTLHIKNADVVVTMDGQRREIANGSVFCRDGVITDVEAGIVDDADTVIDANDAAMTSDCATGIQFAPITAPALEQAISRTCALYNQPKLWAAMQRRAMRHSVGWDRSAQSYLDLYQSTLS